MPSTGGYGRSGVPDIIACARGRFIAIECKAGKGKLTALQARELENISKAGGLSYCVDETGLDDLEAAISSLTSDKEEKSC